MGGRMSAYLTFLTRSYPLFLKGVVMTLEVLVISAVISFSLGILFGVLTSKWVKLPFISPMVEGVCFIYRAVPFFVQLLIVYFVVPDLLGFNLAPFPASVVALGMCSSGYVAQIVKGGINALPDEQYEATYTLGYTKLQSYRYILLPQMFRNTLPSFNNELENLLKSTAVVSSIGMLELTRVGVNLVSREMTPVPTYLTIALFYVCISSLLKLITQKIERKLC